MLHGKDLELTALKALVRTQFLKLFDTFIKVRTGAVDPSELQAVINEIIKIREENPEFDIQSRSFMDDGNGWYELATNVEKYQLKDTADFQKLYTFAETTEHVCNFDAELALALEDKLEVSTSEEEFDRIYNEAVGRIDQQQEVAESIAKNDQSFIDKASKLLTDNKKSLMLAAGAVVAVGAILAYRKYATKETDVVVLDDLLSTIDNSDLF